MLQNATSLRKSAPWPPNISDEHVSCTALATPHASLQILFKCPTDIVFEMLQNHPVLLTFGKVQNPLRLQRKATSEPSKVVWACGGFNVLTWKCALHHNSVHFFNISTSKSAPKPSDIWLRNVLRATKWRALFRHRSFQKCSETVSKCASRHTTACTFSTSQLPKVLRNRHTFDFAMCFTPHNGVHFLDISTSKSGPTLVYFVHFDLEMCFAPQRRAIFHLSSGQLAPQPAALASLLFDPPEPQIIGKTQCFATSLPFSASASSSSYSFSSTLLSSNLSLLFSSLLSSSLLWLLPPLHFPSVHIVGSLTSKLPSAIAKVLWTSKTIVTLELSSSTYRDFVWTGAPLCSGDGFVQITVTFVDLHHEFSDFLSDFTPKIFTIFSTNRHRFWRRLEEFFHLVSWSILLRWRWHMPFTSDKWLINGVNYNSINEVITDL